MITKKIKDVCELVIDCPHSTPVWTDSGVLVFRSKNVRGGHLDLSERSFTSDNEYAKRVVRAVPSPGDLIITREAPMGEVAMIPPGIHGCLGQRMVLLRPNLRITDGRFVLYALMSPKVQHEIKTHEGTGSTVSNLNIPALNALEIPCPLLSEQRAIAHILGTLDDKIELNRRMNETLEAMARAIFKSWFVDFDPVRAKAEGRQPFGMDAETAALFPDSFQDSPLGKIPKGWRAGAIGDCVTAVGGSTPSTKEAKFWDGSIHFATPKDMSSLQFPILFETERRITEAGLAKISSGLLQKGTLLLSSRAPIGYLALTEIPVAVNQGIIAMICNKGLPNLYVLHWAKGNLDTIIANANGTTFLEISKRNFRPIPVVVPTEGVLERFAAFVEPIHKQMVGNVAQSRSLTSIRDSLLPKLISGEIRVGNATGVTGECSP